MNVSIAHTESHETVIVPGAEATDPRALAPQEGFLTTQGLSIVLPAYNEEACIEATVRAVTAAVERWTPSYEILVVNDGSRDETGAVVNQLAALDPHIRCITHEVNKGYGAALVTGFYSAEKSLVFFMDSDGQFDINDLAAFFPLIERYDAVLGYRFDRQDTRMRILNAWGWKTLVWLALGVRARDVDCAFKMFHTNLFQENPLETRGAMINAEILSILKRTGRTVTQVPVQHLPRRSGKATGAHPRVILRAMRELAVYAWRWRVTPAIAKAKSEGKRLWQRAVA